MEDDFKDIEVFDGMTLGNILKEVYVNSVESKRDLDVLINQMQTQLEEEDSISYLGPILNNFIDSRLKTNDQLLKFVATIHKLISLTVSKSASGGELMTPAEKEQLLLDVRANVESIQK